MRQTPRDRVKVVCPFCSTGCSLYIRTVNGGYAGIEYFEEGINEGSLCPKPNDLSFLNSSDRLRKPLRRTEYGFKEISWSEALEEIASRIRSIQDGFGPDAIAFLVSVKIFNEEAYTVQKLARLLGTNNLDHECRRLCQFPTIIAAKQMLGVGSLTGTFQDIAESEVIVLWGMNAAETFPVLMGKYVMRAKEFGAKIIVIDPVKTETAWKADLWIPVRPGTDLALANSIMNVLINEDLYDRSFVRTRTEGFEELARIVSRYPPEEASRITGVPPYLIREAAHIMASTGKGSLIWSSGLIHNAQATNTCRALYSLAALLGWYGKEGTCVGGFKGQNNVEGLVHMGVAPSAFPGGVPLNDEDGRKRLARLWGVEDLPATPGKNVVKLYESIDSKSLRMLYVIGANPAVSEPNSEYVVEHLKKLDFLVVQDIFLTETARLADIVLPAAAWAEKEGSFTSIERRVQWSFKALSPPGEAMPDLKIFVALAKRLGLEKHFPATTPEEVLNEIREAVPGLYGGVTPERLKGSPKGILVPCPDPKHPGTRILCRDRFKTHSGKLKLMTSDHSPLKAEEYPLILVTTKTVGVWLTNAITREARYLAERWNAPVVLVNGSTASRLGLSDGSEAIIETKVGRMKVRIRVTSRVREDTVVLPWHWGANRLTDESLRDPDSGVPALKQVPCKLVPSER